MLSCTDLCDLPQLPIVCIAEDLFDVLNNHQGCEQLFTLHDYTGDEPAYGQGRVDVIYQVGNTTNQVSPDEDLNESCFGLQQSTTAIFLRARTLVCPGTEWDLKTGEQLLGAVAYQLLARFAQYANSEDAQQYCSDMSHPGTTKVAPVKTESGHVIGFDLQLRITYNVSYQPEAPDG